MTLIAHSNLESNSNSSSRKSSRNKMIIFIAVGAALAVALIIVGIIVYNKTSSSEENGCVNIEKPGDVVNLSKLSALQDSIKSQYDILSNPPTNPKDGKIDTVGLLKALEDIKANKLDDLSPINASMPEVKAKIDSLIKVTKYMSSEKKEPLTPDMAEAMISVSGILKCFGDLKEYVKNNSKPVDTQSSTKKNQSDLTPNVTKVDDVPPIKKQEPKFDEHEISRINQKIQAIRADFYNSINSVDPLNIDAAEKPTEDPVVPIVDILSLPKDKAFREIEKVYTSYVFFKDHDKINKSKQFYTEYQNHLAYLKVLQSYTADSIKAMLGAKEISRVEAAIKQDQFLSDAYFHIYTFARKAIHIDVIDGELVKVWHTRIYFKDGKMQLKKLSTLGLPGDFVRKHPQMWNEFVKEMEAVCKPSARKGIDEKFDTQQYLAFDAIQSKYATLLTDAEERVKRGEEYLDVVKIVQMFNPTHN